MSTRRTIVGASVCSFTFADGRRCRTPRCKDHPHLCYFHAQKEAEAAATQKIGHDIGTWCTGEIVSAGDLSGALGEVFSYAAKGQIKPKTAATLAYLGNALLQSIKVAQHEYINAWGADNWRRVIICGTKPPPPRPQPALKPAPASDSPQAVSPASAPDPSADLK
jgi:hypothetical protein